MALAPPAQPSTLLAANYSESPNGWRRGSAPIDETSARGDAASAGQRRVNAQTCACSPPSESNQAQYMRGSHRVART